MLLTRARVELDPGMMVIRRESKEGCGDGLRAEEWVREFV